MSRNLLAIVGVVAVLGAGTAAAVASQQNDDVATVAAAATDSTTAAASTSSPGPTASVATTAPASVPVASETAVATVAARQGGPDPVKTFLVATHRDGMAMLEAADRTTGKVSGTVATLSGDKAGYGAATIAPDGSVWAVEHFGAGPYDTRLVHLAGSARSVVLPYATAVAVSPDGSRLAVTVVSPDANGDGKGTASLRIGRVGESAFTTITESTFPVGSDGAPAVQLRAPSARVWLDGNHVGVFSGCCDSGTFQVLAADKTAATGQPTLRGSYVTDAVAQYADSSVLVPVEKRTQDATGAWGTASYDLYRVSVAQPGGVKVATVPATAEHPYAALREYVTKNRLRPLAFATLPDVTGARGEIG